MAQATKRRLDRKARIAVGTAAVMLIAVPALMIGKLATDGAGDPVAQPFEPGKDQLVLLRNGSTMLVRHQSARRITDWIELGNRSQETFQVGNANFAPGSTTLTHDGWEHLVTFAHILRAHPGVRAVILFSAYHGHQSTARLEHLRANRIYNETLNQGVSAQQIAVAPEGYEAGHNAASDEGLDVVLTNSSARNHQG